MPSGDVPPERLLHAPDRPRTFMKDTGTRSVQAVPQEPLQAAAIAYRVAQLRVEALDEAKRKLFEAQEQLNQDSFEAYDCLREALRTLQKAALGH